jgi:hypothetical protein
MAVWLRWAIALCQIAGGAWMMAYVFTGPIAAPFPYVLMSEVLGAVAIYAGVALGRGSAVGFTMSRIIQGIQIVRVYSGPLLLVIAIGPQLLVNLFFGPHFSISTSTPVPLPVSHVVEFSAAFDVLGGGQWADVAPTGFGINLVAVFAFFLLIKGRPAQRDGLPVEALPPR